MRRDCIDLMPLIVINGSIGDSMILNSGSNLTGRETRDTYTFLKL